jgi:hypothetical protein
MTFKQKNNCDSFTQHDMQYLDGTYDGAINSARIRSVMQALIALSLKPEGFSASNVE